MKGLGIADSGWALSSSDPEVPAWESLSKAEQEVSDLRMAIYAAQIDSMDRGLGRLVAALQRNKMLENTIILVMSDYGGCHEEIHWKSPFPDFFGSDESFESYGRLWANLSNVPFRLFKSWVHEGGIATPLTAHWPVGISEPGRLYHEPAHLIDVMPICIDLARAGYAQSQGRILPIESTTLLPALNNRQLERSGGLYWEHEANRAYRSGK